MMVSKQPSASQSICRRGSVLPILAVSLVALIGFVALAVDVGMLTIAKAQGQNAADLAALAAARSLNGIASGNYNESSATTNAQTILSYNYILGQSIQSSQLQLSYGSYDYNQSSETFSANFPATSGSPLTAVSSTVVSNNPAAAFSTVFGYQFLPNVTAVATAVHRPRDIALVMDLSGSMRMGTCLGYDFVLSSRTTNNPDTVYPTFGHYSSASGSLDYTGSNRTSSYDGYTISPSNTTAPNSSYTLTYVNSFYQNAAYASTLIRAFDSYTSTDGGNSWTAPAAGTVPQLPPSTYTTVPGGDVPLVKQGSSTPPTYASDVNDVLGSTSTNILWELDGYSAYAAGKPDTSGTGGVPQVWTQVDYSAPASPPANGSLPFNGYTQGPGYYGMTFFMWPPDPRNTTALAGATLTSYLSALGVNATDQTTLSNIWALWQGQKATGLTNLQNWLQGKALGGASQLPTFSDYYTPTSTTALVPGITKWNGVTLTTANSPRTYYAVCRLFNRAYPGGTAWTSTSFSADWRLRFFNTNNNTVLFNSSTDTLNVPSTSTTSGYTINYLAIWSWISQSVNSSGQLVNPFPQQMRAGRIKYYGAIPTTFTGSWPSYGSTDQRFWKEFVDYALGFRQTSASTYQDVSAMAGYGSDVLWGKSQLSAPPAAPQYMSYTDNPYRPLLRYWFGPLNAVDYLQNFNLWTIDMWMSGSGYYVMQPGDGYEAPLYTAKQAYLASISTMQSNHPNDWFTPICYSFPRGSSNGTVESSAFLGRFNCVRSPLGTNYNYAQAALVFPFSTINADGSCNNTELTPYTADPATSIIPSADFVDTPRGDGETCFAMALMLAYNQFLTTSPSDATLRSFVSSSPITFPTGMAGGMGRKGAQKVIIFETDGLPNTYATASLVTNGSYKYYPIRYDMNNPSGSQYPSVSVSTITDTGVMTQVNSLVSQLASTFSTNRNPFRLYAVGFGPVFQAGAPNETAAINNLQSMQTTASTPGSPSIITGTDAEMSTTMITTFTNILQSGVQIALIQ
ncbi:MAG TPA: pilus assembly protein TadG-related protein [Gemmataceae bacterium]|nr:pilus assembly protein TadG-related protein [Gemmataceae bacterium]